MPDVPVTWTVVVPVKRRAAAKSRLALPAQVRAELARAMAEDTVDAALTAAGVAEVLVVTPGGPDDADWASLGARVLVDDSELNPALAQGAAAAATEAVAMLPADLPALTAADLAAVLDRAADLPAAVVADRRAVGTTLLAGQRTVLSPRFGGGSWQAHLTAGATDLTAHATPGLRTDVDLVADLQAALGLGVGSRTLQVVRHRAALLDRRAG